MLSTAVVSSRYRTFATVLWNRTAEENLAKHPDDPQFPFSVLRATYRQQGIPHNSHLWEEAGV